MITQRDLTPAQSRNYKPVYDFRNKHHVTRSSHEDKRRDLEQCLRDFEDMSKAEKRTMYPAIRNLEMELFGEVRTPFEGKLKGEVICKGYLKLTKYRRQVVTSVVNSFDNCLAAESHFGFSLHHMYNGTQKSIKYEQYRTLYNYRKEELE